MNRISFGLCVLLFASNCSKKDSDTNKAEVPPTAAVEKEVVSTDEAPAPMSKAEGIAAAKAGAQKLGKTLKKSLMAAMQDGGVDGALRACADEAQTLTGGAGTSRLRVGRATLRLRNQKNAEAPDWVNAWLKKTGERKAEGLVGVEEVVDGTAHFLKPLPVGGICLSCHGDTKTHSDEMKALLSSQYPDDKAVGYELGDLRGVIWAEYDLITGL